MSYHAWQGGHLTGDPEPVAALAHDAFRATVLSPSFSCTAGAAAVRTGSYRFCALDRLGDPRSAQQLAAHLREFITEFPLPSTRFATCVASFREPAAASPARFEKLLWSTLEQLHELDTKPWDPSVSRDPANPEFSFSFHGRAFFVIGMHAGSPRWTRRLAWPTLVFNAHAQFEQLRQEGHYARLSDTIRKRDARLQGAPNPNLSDFGTESEARQYSGNETAPDWRCPFPPEHDE